MGGAWPHWGKRAYDGEGTGLKRTHTLLGLVLVGLSGWFAIDHGPWPDSPRDAAVAHHTPTAAEVQHSRDLLNALPIKGRAPKTGYTRDHFGPTWSDNVDLDYGHNGCDTRNDILHRDLTHITTRPGTHNCIVETGTLHDPYSGHTIAFTRGPHTSTHVHIDHVVSLSDAWQKGAQHLTPREREHLANDPRNLLAVSGELNNHKRDSDAATWLPPNKKFRCQYARIQIDIKTTYRLWITDAEYHALHHQLDTCH